MEIVGNYMIVFVFLFLIKKKFIMVGFMGFKNNLKSLWLFKKYYMYVWKVWLKLGIIWFIEWICYLVKIDKLGICNNSVDFF